MRPASHRSVCVFCGSRPGGDPAYAAAATELGVALAAAGLRLVYGTALLDYPEPRGTVHGSILRTDHASRAPPETEHGEVPGIVLSSRGGEIESPPRFASKFIRF